LCDGTLNDFIKGKLPTIPRSAIQDKDIIGQIILGLSYLHGKNIVHKDLTPNNVLLSKKEDLILVKLIDFGLSKQLKDGKSSFSQTKNLGTMGFIAPELLKNSKKTNIPPKPTFASDIWSLGVVVFFVLSQGEHPYGPDHLVRDYFIEEFKVPSNIHILNDWLAIHFVIQLMHRRPKQRPNVFLLLSHPYFTANSRPMKHMVNRNFWNFFLSNENKVKICFKGYKIKEWFEAYREEMINNFDWDTRTLNKLEVQFTFFPDTLSTIFEL
jgi:serine/threonine-protein kinase/endoribonuclease IRE1